MTFTIEYSYNNSPRKKMKVKNCMSELHAKMKLGRYMESKHGKGELAVFNCICGDGIFGDIFNDIFK